MLKPPNPANVAAIRPPQLIYECCHKYLMHPCSLFL